MPHILITGSPGSGKTFISEYFRSKDLHAIDGDSYPGLAAWYNDVGEKVWFQPGVGPEWFDKHEYLWDEELLNKILDENETVYLFGSSDNVYKLSYLFDKRYFLKLPAEELEKRLTSDLRENGFGKNEKDREAVISWLPFFEQNARKYGFENIDGMKSPEEIMKEIVRI